MIAKHFVYVFLKSLKLYQYLLFLIVYKFCFRFYNLRDITPSFWFIYRLVNVNIYTGVECRFKDTWSTNNSQNQFITKISAAQHHKNDPEQIYMYLFSQKLRDGVMGRNITERESCDHCHCSLTQKKQFSLTDRSKRKW